MLRKIVAVFLALATVVMLFTACDGDENVTTDPISTGNVSTTESTKPQPVTYVLTTGAEKTVPWQETTRFETTTADFGSIIVPTDTIDVPPVNIVGTTGSSLPANTTAPTTASNPLLSTTSTTKPTTTAKVEKFPTALIIDSEGYNSSNGKLYLGISPSGWSSDIKASTINISIKIDGVTVANKVACSVTAAKNSDGMQEIVIDLQLRASQQAAQSLTQFPKVSLFQKQAHSIIHLIQAVLQFKSLSAGYPPADFFA